MAYTIYASFIFFLVSIFFVPLINLLSLDPKWHSAALAVHQSWAKTYFRLAFFNVHIEGKEHLKSDQQYIFCANHFSYLDIAVFYLLHHGKFIGKTSVGKIPVFGYFFRKMHIPVNRSSSRSRGDSLRLSKEELKKGFNLSIYPEGGILVKEEDLPYMVSFKDGAFKLAVEFQIPIVPIVYPNNFLIIPDRSPIRVHRNPIIIKVLEPLWPESSDESESERLKKETYRLIQNELLRYHPDKVKAVD